MDATIRRSGARPFSVHVFDVSRTGCKLELVECLRVGERVWVKFAELEAFEGTVRWTAGHVGGIQFNREIYAAVFDQMVARQIGTP